MERRIEYSIAALLALVVLLPAQVAFVVLADNEFDANDYALYGTVMACVYTLLIVVALG